MITFRDSGEVFSLSRFDFKLAKTSAQDHFYGVKFDLMDSFLMFFKSAEKFFENSKILLLLGIMSESDQYSTCNMLYGISSTPGVKNDHNSPFELRNVTSRVNTVSNDLFESTEKKFFFDP